MKTTIDEQSSFAYDQKDIMNNEMKDLEKNSSASVTNTNATKDESPLEAELVTSPLQNPELAQAPELSEEEYRALVAQEVERHKKMIICSELSPDLAKRLSQTIVLLKELESDAQDKQEQALDKNNSIKAVVQELMKAGFIQVNEQEFNRSEESVQEYVRLLDDVKKEINEEMARIMAMQSIEIGKEFTVWKTAPDSYSEYVEQVIKRVKHYIKSVKRDLNVSYSRYCFGFDAQMKRIESIQRYLERAQKIEKSPK